MKSILWSALSLSASVVAETIIERDVAIVGGGAAGTFAAIRLQQMGLSVALIEKSHRLGGHVSTWIQPSTGIVLDYGVQIFTNQSVVHDYFSHFNISLVTSPGLPGGVTTDTNFLTASPVNATIPTPDLVAALATYVRLLNQYSYINGEWNLPDPVPEDLLLPWGEFMVQHNITALATLVYTINQGQADILSLPALYVLRQLPLSAIQSLSSGFLAAPIGVQTLYDRALAELGDSAFLNATISHITRPQNPSPYDPISICLTTPYPLTIRAKTLLLTLPPTLPNLLPFLDLSETETSLFSQFSFSAFYNALLRNTGLPPNTTYRNLNPSLPFDIPALPAVYEIGATAAPGISGMQYGAPSSHPVTDGQVQADILATIARLREAAGVLDYEGEPEFVGFNNHAPNHLAVSASTIRDGFYTKLKALQGPRGTFWSGATWASDSSASIWDFTEHVILPRIVEAVRGGS
ncbi:flavin-containing superfamily Amine oxidase like protein [Zymoseptoria brevis]|uniref:Flavin-containing superfamily Amine oxidase like protein n=1 Tax=Zymoseptoria brevis TaxID=1047168 RepID=A0A0F4GTI5_9PEZI|nr:flavin-containing superfamily Amine oxidase like protein [Zymoseptoria brevis]